MRRPPFYEKAPLPSKRPRGFPASGEFARLRSPPSLPHRFLRLRFSDALDHDNLGGFWSGKSQLIEGSEQLMAKPHRNLKKANHGRRPANSKARRLKRANIKT
jgi:hypothetical protein